MTATPTRPAAPRWGLTIGLSLAGLFAAIVFGFVALLSGSEFAGSGPLPSTQSVVVWMLAGLSMAAPGAALPTLGFSTSRRTAFGAAAATVVVVALLGVFVLNQQ